MDSDKGEAVQDEYAFPDFEIGFVPDANTVVQWDSILALRLYVPARQTPR